MLRILLVLLVFSSLAQLRAESKADSIYAICILKKNQKMKAIIPEGADISIWKTDGSYYEKRVAQISEDSLYLFNQKDSAQKDTFALKAIGNIKTEYKNRRNVKVLSITTGLGLWIGSNLLYNKTKPNSFAEDLVGGLFAVGFTGTIGSIFFYRPQVRFNPQEEAYTTKRIPHYKIHSKKEERKTERKIKRLP